MFYSVVIGEGHVPGHGGGVEAVVDQTLGDVLFRHSSRFLWSEGEGGCYGEGAAGKATKW